MHTMKLVILELCNLVIIFVINHYKEVNSSKESLSICLQNLIEEGGIIGLWRGNLAAVLRTGPKYAIKFSTYERIKRLIKGDDEKKIIEKHERFIAGALAGGVSQTAIYPLDVLRTRLVLRKTGQFNGIFDAARKICGREGFRCFYRGYIPYILAISPYNGIELTVYETLKQEYVQTYSESQQPPLWVLLGCINVATVLGLICTYPLELVGTRMQAYETNTTMRNVLRTLLRQQGVRGLYKGFTPFLIMVIPQFSMNYLIYEYISRLLDIEMR